MWDQHKQKRFSQLRARQEAGTLQPGEALELDRLTQEIEDREAAYLATATQRLRAEREQLQVMNGDLRVIVARKEALANRLEQVIRETRMERDAIEQEVKRILAATPTVSSLKSD